MNFPAPVGEAELARREGRDYEPASVLLERIRAERASQGEKSNQKRKVSKKMKSGHTESGDLARLSATNNKLP